MTTHRSPTKRRFSFVPAEAASISAQLCALNCEGEAPAAGLCCLEGNLASGWDDKARARFLTSFDSQPGGSGADAAFTANKTSEMASLRLTIWETVWEEVEVPS